MNYGYGGIPPNVNQYGNSVNQAEYMGYQGLNCNAPVGIRPNGPSNFPPYGEPIQPPYYNSYGNPSGPPNYTAYGGPPVPPNTNPYQSPYAPQNYNPSAPPNYNAYGGPPMQPNFNQYANPVPPSNYGSYPNTYNGTGQPLHTHHSGGSGMVNKLEKMLHVDLNGDGTIGGIPQNSLHHKHHGHKHHGHKH